MRDSLLYGTGSPPQREGKESAAEPAQELTEWRVFHNYYGKEAEVNATYKTRGSGVEGADEAAELFSDSGLIRGFPERAVVLIASDQRCRYYTINEEKRLVPIRFVKAPDPRY